MKFRERKARQGTLWLSEPVEVTVAVAVAMDVEVEVPVAPSV